jgi:hypothetical protein
MISTDASGALWLFGGYGFDSFGNYGYLNDLWKFNPALGANGEWTWMGGSGIVGGGDFYSGVGSVGTYAGVYGTLGTEASTNTPGSRAWAVGWSDSSGNLWLFGGEGFDSTETQGWLNDLWEYKP